MMPSLPITLAEGLLDHVVNQPIFKLGGLQVTNHTLMLTVATAVLLVVFISAAGKIARGAKFGTQGRLAQMIEVVLIYLRDDLVKPNLKHLTPQYLGFIWTTFFFILTLNLLGLIPWGDALNLAAWITGTRGEHAAHYSHWQGTPTGNINVTATLALCSLFMMFFTGLRHVGLGYFSHFAPIPIWGLMKDGKAAMLPVAILLVFLELIGMAIKPLALAMRLFANMVAGHMVLAAMLGLIIIAAKALGTAGGLGISVPVILGSLALSFLELFVAFLQAYLFTFLTVLFIAQGAVHEHHDGHDHDPAHAH